MAAEHVTPEDRLQYFVNVDKANRPLADHIPGGYQDAPLRRSDLEVVLATEEAALAIVQRLQAELSAARSLRLDRPSQAVDPAVHTPGRVRCYLKAHGWHLIAERETYDMWQLGHEQMANAICVPTKPQASDYCKRLGIALGDLAQQYETGELAVLADIEAAGDD